jgi:hypothetical protein
MLQLYGIFCVEVLISDGEFQSRTYAIFKAPIDLASFIKSVRIFQKINLGFHHMLTIFAFKLRRKIEIVKLDMSVYLLFVKCLNVFKFLFDSMVDPASKGKVTYFYLCWIKHENNIKNINFRKIYVR